MSVPQNEHKTPKVLEVTVKIAIQESERHPFKISRLTVNQPLEDNAGIITPANKLKK